MLISVIIPSYKPGDYLWECLKSLNEQTLSKENYEIVLILNGFIEPYKSIIEKGIANNLQGMSVNFICTEQGGVSNARNIGLDNAKGEYITFLDDDDIISANYLENLLEVSSPSCVGCANSYCFVESISEKNKNFITYGYEKCSRLKFSLYHYRCFLSPPVAKLIHKNIIDIYRFPIDLKKSEDSVFCMLISPNIRDMKLAPADTIYYQRERVDSAMRTKTNISEILKDHLYIEWKYITEWYKHPFRYNVLFVLSRIVACCKNCYTYIKRNM